MHNATQTDDHSEHYHDLLIHGALSGCPYTQIAVYFALERDAPLTARGLAAQLPRSRQSVNKALAALADENLIERLAGPDVQGQPRYRLADRWPA